MIRHNSEGAFNGCVNTYVKGVPARRRAYVYLNSGISSGSEVQLMPHLLMPWVNPPWVNLPPAKFASHGLESIAGAHSYNLARQHARSGGCVIGLAARDRSHAWGHL
jgi:hypothetical protein